MANGVWDPGWQERIGQVVQGMGYGSVWEFANAHPLEPFGKLYQTIQDEADSAGVPVALVQVTRFYSARRSSASWLAASASTLEKGWRKGKHFRERAARMLADLPLPPAQPGEPDGGVFLAAWEALLRAEIPEG